MKLPIISIGLCVHSIGLCEKDKIMSFSTDLSPHIFLDSMHTAETKPQNAILSKAEINFLSVIALILEMRKQ